MILRTVLQVLMELSRKEAMLHYIWLLQLFHMVKLLILRLCQRFVFCVDIRIYWGGGGGGGGGTTQLNSQWKGEHHCPMNHK